MVNGITNFQDVQKKQKDILPTLTAIYQIEQSCFHPETELIKIESFIYLFIWFIFHLFYANTNAKCDLQSFSSGAELSEPHNYVK